MLTKRSSFDPSICIALVPAQRFVHLQEPQTINYLICHLHPSVHSSHSLATATTSMKQSSAAARAPARANGRTSSKNQLLPLLLLCTGTLVVIANQFVSNQAAVSPQAQLLTLVRYLCTFGLSAVLVAREKLTQPAAAKAKASKFAKAAAAGPKSHVILLVLICVGLLDVGCYSLYNIGFAWCGSALATIVLAASGQIATALLSVLVLKRQLHARHLAAVTVVTVGLVLRSMDDILAGNFSSSMSDSKQTYGALLVVASALLFSILGVVYEKRSENPDRKVTQAQTSFAVSGVSLALTLVHQLLYCLPHWHQLVTKPLEASGFSTKTVLLTHAVYGMITAVHQFVQLRVLASHGAMSVGLVNAVRASVVSVVSSMLFCHVKPQLCLTYWRGISALVVTVGAVQWVVAGKPITREQHEKKEL